MAVNDYVEKSENRQIISFPKQKKKEKTYLYLHDRGSKIKKFTQDHIIYYAGIMKIKYEESEWILRDACREVLPDLVPGFEKIEIETDYQDDKKQLGQILYGTKRKSKRVDGSTIPKIKGIIGERGALQLGKHLSKVVKYVHHGRNYFIHHWQYEEMRRIWGNIEGRKKVIQGLDMDRAMIEEYVRYFFALRLYWGKVMGVRTFVEKDVDFPIISKTYLPKVPEEFGLNQLRKVQEDP